MSQRLFTAGKVPVFLDSYAPGIEKRRGEEVKIYTLTLRVQPFDAQLAGALEDGVGDPAIKATLFRLDSGEPKANFTRHDFQLGLERQKLLVFASRDTPTARIAFDQVKVGGTYVRTQKDLPNQLALVFRASFGPLGPEEMAYVYEWYRGQRAVTFEEAEDSIEFASLDDHAAAEEDDDDVPAADARPAPMFDTDAEGHPLPPPPPAAKPPRRRHAQS